MRTATLAYTSRADGTAPLYADAAWTADGRRKPLLVVMHGYRGDRRAVTPDLQELAARGVFALAPDLRGRGDSAGRWDSGGLDVHDIRDAVLAALERWPDEIDERNLNLVGYSGGGGNAIACAVRFPDLFHTLISFFGISDYGAWHRSRGRPDCNEVMEAALGGPPDQVPALYEARNFIPAAANARHCRFHFFWDVTETMCPPPMIEEFCRDLPRATCHISRPGDARRWLHGYRGDVPDLRAADELFLPDVLAPKTAPPQLPTRGRLVVPGYLVTRAFEVWIEDGQRGRVTVAYDLTGATPVVRIEENPANYRVRVASAAIACSMPRKTSS